MAMLFRGKDNNIGTIYEYLYGQTNELKRIISILEKNEGMLKLDSIKDKSDKDLISQFFTEKELELAKQNKYHMDAIEITFHPFAQNAKVVNLPRLRIQFSNGEQYLRKYDAATPLMISQETEKLMSPITMEYIIEIIDIKEVN